MSNVTENQALAALARARNIKAQIDSLTAELKGETDTLAAYAGSKPGKVTLSNGASYTVSENNTYSKDKMAELLSGGQFRLVSERVLVPAKVKALYGHIYAAAKENKGVKVTL